MNVITGFAIVLFCVFGGYMLAGGYLGPILYALPFEFMIIGGSALGSLLMANSFTEVKHIAAAVSKALRGSQFKEQDYIDLCTCMHKLLRIAQQKGPAGLEPHIERPEESAVFAQYPKILNNHHACTLICDYLRMVGMNADDPHQIEDVMARELKKIREEEMHAAHALQTIADALPALGIVAAVMGVIKTMGSIDQPPAVLGGMIGGALVGPFLGVLLAYGLIGPFATRLKSIVDEECQYFEVIRAVLVAHLHGNAPQVSVETGRKVAPSHLMPSFQELEGVLQELQVA